MQGRGSVGGARGVLQGAAVLACMSQHLRCCHAEHEPLATHAPRACSYAIQLISAASLISQKRKSATVDVEDVSKAYTLFLDVQRSVQYLQVGAACGAACGASG